MNRREVKEYIADDKNYEIAEGNEFIRLEILRFGSLAFGQIAVNEIRNRIELITNPDAAPRYGFKRQGYFYELDEEHHAIGYTVSLTSVQDRIWKEAKKK